MCVRTCAFVCAHLHISPTAPSIYTSYTPHTLTIGTVRYVCANACVHVYTFDPLHLSTTPSTHHTLERARIHNPTILLPFFAPLPTTPFTTFYLPHTSLRLHIPITYFCVRIFTYYTFCIHLLCTTRLSARTYICLLYFFLRAPLPTTPFTHALHTLACLITYPYCNFFRVHTFTYYTCHLHLLSTTHLSVRAYIFLLSYHVRTFAFYTFHLHLSPTPFILYTLAP